MKDEITPADIDTTAEEDDEATADEFSASYGSKPPDTEVNTDDDAPAKDADDDDEPAATPPAKSADDDDAPTPEQVEADRLAAETEAAEATAKENKQYWDDVAGIHSDVDLDALLTDGSPLNKRALDWLAKQDTATRRLVSPGESTAVQMARAISLMKSDGVFKEPESDPGTQGVLAYLAESGIADTEITTVIDGEETKMTLKELATRYPDIFESQYAMLRTMAASTEKRIQILLDDRLAAGNYVRADEITDLRDAANESRIAKAHSDYATITTSAKFLEYKNSLPPTVKALWDNGPDGRIDVLNLYKQSVLKDAGASARATRGAIHKKKAGVHADTLRGDGAGRTGKAEPVDTEEAFDEHYGKPAA